MFTGILIIGFLLFALCFAICYNRFVDIHNRKQLQKKTHPDSTRTWEEINEESPIQ